MSTATDEIPIAVIAKNAREELRIGLSEFRGVRLLNSRVWWPSPDGTMRPGKDGYAIRIDRLAELHKAIGDALDVARRRGWVPADAEAAE